MFGKENNFIHASASAVAWLLVVMSLAEDYYSGYKTDKDSFQECGWAERSIVDETTGTRLVSAEDYQKLCKDDDIDEACDTQPLGQVFLGFSILTLLLSSVTIYLSMVNKFGLMLIAGDIVCGVFLLMAVIIWFSNNDLCYTDDDIGDEMVGSSSILAIIAALLYFAIGGLRVFLRA